MMSTTKTKQKSATGSRDKDLHNHSFFADLRLPQKSSDLRQSKSLAQFTSCRKGLQPEKPHFDSSLFKLRSCSQPRGVAGKRTSSAATKKYVQSIVISRMQSSQGLDREAAGDCVFDREVRYSSVV